MVVEWSRVAISGGAGFLGSHFAREWIRSHGGALLDIDKLTYAGSRQRVASIEPHPSYSFVQQDIAHPAVVETLRAFRPELVVDFAAESHVTRSEIDSSTFHETNVIGTKNMLEAADAAGARMFIHLSTDEVYGPVGPDVFMNEADKAPGDSQATSVYAKTKGLADDAVLEADVRCRVCVIRPTNCFGPWQHPEKAIARWITQGLDREPLTVWGDGSYIRQWISAADLTAAIRRIAGLEDPADVYNVAPKSQELTNREVASSIAQMLDLPAGSVTHTEYDRPNHDRRYALNAARLVEAGWASADFLTQLRDTIHWYQHHREWWTPLKVESEEFYRDLESVGGWKVSLDGDVW